jgi:hypothetical protein
VSPRVLAEVYGFCSAGLQWPRSYTPVRRFQRGAPAVLCRAELTRDGAAATRADEQAPELLGISRDHADLTELLGRIVDPDPPHSLAGAPLETLSSLKFSNGEHRRVGFGSEVRIGPAKGQTRD